MPHLINVLRGFLMGSADVVPGVSGGTIALVLGIYERLVHNIRTGAGALGWLARAKPAAALRRAREVEWSFLLPLLGGIALAIVSLAALITYFLDNEPIGTAALFFGLVLGSIAVAWRLVRIWAPLQITIGLVVAIAAFFLLGLRSGEITDPGLGLVFGSGAIAIVAMILPGISGSFILLMLGMYEAVIGSVDDRDLVPMLVFLGGAVIGLALFSTVLDRMLRDHHDAVMAGLIGLMAGSLRVLWPWPDGTNTANLGAPTNALVPVLMALLGLAAVLVIERLGRSEKRVPNSE